MTRGFTLNDVLACTVVLVLGVALALPFAGRGESAGCRSSCLANMKQIGASVMLYATDYDDTLPVTTERKPRLGFGAHWSLLVQPYLASRRLFVCPGDAEPASARYKGREIAGEVLEISYINNYAAIPAHDFYPVPRSVITAPESMILLGERRAKTYLIGPLPAWKGTSGFFPGQPCHDQPFGERYRRVDAAEARRAVATATADDQLLILRTDWSMHGSVSNYLFTDGHAATEPLERTLDPTAYQWGERFYPRSKPDADCDGRARRKTPALPTEFTP